MIHGSFFAYIVNSVFVGFMLFHYIERFLYATIIPVVFSIRRLIIIAIYMNSNILARDWALAFINIGIVINDDDIKSISYSFITLVFYEAF